MFSGIRKFLDGKKMYLLMASGIIGAVLGWANGELSDAAAIGAIWGSLGLGATKSAIAKT